MATTRQRITARRQSMCIRVNLESTAIPPGLRRFITCRAVAKPVM
jgi:hypothetical protein